MIFDFLEIYVRGSTGHPLSRARRRDWALLLKNFEVTPHIPYIIFLGEILKCHTGNNVVFSGYNRTTMGIGDEKWNLRAGNACIYREKYTELSDGWQRVEVLGDRTEILDLGEGRVMEWNGDYGDFPGMRLFLAGVSVPSRSVIAQVIQSLSEDTGGMLSGVGRSAQVAGLPKSMTPFRQPRYCIDR
jgi:hypothetical protein